MATFPELETGQVPMTAQDVPDETLQRARLTVAHNALDAEDCAWLLDMLGLVPDGMRIKRGLQP